MSLFESPWQAIQTKILKQWIDSAKTQKLFDASFFNFFFIVQSISQWIIIHLNGWYCAYFLPPRRNFTKHNALSKKARSRCCKFSIFGIFWAACMKNQSRDTRLGALGTQFGASLEPPKSWKSKSQRRFLKLFLIFSSF